MRINPSRAFTLVTNSSTSVRSDPIPAIRVVVMGARVPHNIIATASTTTSAQPTSLMIPAGARVELDISHGDRIVAVAIGAGDLITVCY